MDTAEFIYKAQGVHGERYDYTDVDYYRSNHKIKIKCSEHGIFLQSPNNHLAGNNCPICANNTRTENQSMSVDIFAKRAYNIHGKKYLYDLSSYTRAGAKVRIICADHGEFWQSAWLHLTGRGCHECGRKYCVKENEWLDTLPGNINRQQTTHYKNK